ncbi:uncharacterized mitochondrial protein AtMg00810-like [Juglans regia]|uniref:Uncharacterized mitochondrial protein AtMg00810-like n=1 Tax=Juglans regia TaxID=51240 RepID=A0A6P9E7W4_JUGRE|nr:uncharacterized mitochondrial protein AtMg00810-like [Juglans regia]
MGHKYYNLISFVASQFQVSSFAELLKAFLYSYTLMSSDSSQIEWFISKLARQFSIKDLGHLHHFLGLEVHKLDNGLLISQNHYAQTLLQCVEMIGCKPISTPISSKGQQLSSSTELFIDSTYYSSIVGSLQYLTFTRPDLSFSMPTNYAYQFMQAPTATHFRLMKIILKYVQGTANFNTRLLADSTLNLYAYSNVDWACCPLTRHSISCYYTFLCSNLISLRAKKQATLACSSAEAKH